MFGLFNSKKEKGEENPISSMFSDLTVNQKMSVVNLLFTLGVCDAGQGDREKELQYLNTYIRILGVRSGNCMSYLDSGGHARIISDLNPLSTKQKELLAIASWEMITCDGQPNDMELQVTSKFFMHLGISEEKFVETIQKIQAIMNLGLKK